MVSSRFATGRADAPPPPPARRATPSVDTMESCTLNTKYGTIGVSLELTGPGSATGRLGGQHLTNRGRELRTTHEATFTITDGVVSINPRGFEKRYTDRRWPSIPSWTPCGHEPTVKSMLADLEAEITALTASPQWGQTAEALHRGRAEARAKSQLDWHLRSLARKRDDARAELAAAEAAMLAAEDEVRADLTTAGYDVDAIERMISDGYGTAP